MSRAVPRKVKVIFVSVPLGAIATMSRRKYWVKDRRVASTPGLTR
jgi:hypothetical protein